MIGPHPHLKRSPETGPLAKTESHPPGLAVRPTPPPFSSHGDKMTRVAGRIAARLVALIAVGILLVFTKPVLLPLVVAFLMSVLLLPLTLRLIRLGVPGALAILLAQGVGTLPPLMLGFVFFASAGSLNRQVPKYQAALTIKASETVDDVVDLIGRGGGEQYKSFLKQELKENLVPKVMNEGVSLVQSSVTTATVALGYFFLMILMTTFILMEGRRFREKITEAYGADNALLSSLEGIGSDVRTYVVAKTMISGATGLCVWVFLSIMGVDFAGFWGLLAFPLNFIPTVGAVAASIPPILLALIDPEIGAWGFAGTVVGLLAVNGIIGSFIDPRFMGRSLQLSPLVVFVSMLLWALLWGPMGMLLAVPIMVSVKVICSHVEGLEPIATLMKA